MPTPVTIWHSRSVSDSSSDETLLGNPTQDSLPNPSKSEPPRGFSSPPESVATAQFGAVQVEDEITDDPDMDAENFWIEKDAERLEVIADMEKKMTEMKAELVGTVTAFQLASTANSKIQAELGNKNLILSQMEEDIDDLGHKLDVADMDNEKLKKDLARSQRDRKHQFSRAEEALALIEVDPSNEVLSKLVQDKTEAEARHESERRVMESEMGFLKSQLDERCNSVIHLTKSLARVADSDQWKEIRRELEEVMTRAGNLPDKLDAAWHECGKWKNQYDSLWKNHEKLLLEQASLEKELEYVKNFDLTAMRKLRIDLESKAAKSIRTLMTCVKTVFERMVRCTLFLENQGYLSFDKEHDAIHEQVSKLTGNDYQQDLIDYYDVHDIGEYFSLGEDEDEGRWGFSNKGPAEFQEQDHQGTDQVNSEEGIDSDSNTNFFTSDLAAGPKDSTPDSSSAPAPAMTGSNSVFAAAAHEEENQEATVTQKAQSEREVSHTEEAPKTFPTAASQALGSSSGFAYSEPIFGSKAADASTTSTPADRNGSDAGRPFTFGIGRNPPASLFAMPVADSKAESGQAFMSREPLKTPRLSNGGEGKSQDIWKDISFATAENNPFSFEAKSSDKASTTNLFQPSPPAQATTSSSENSHAEEGNKATGEAAPSTTKATFFPSQPQAFNFGGSTGPVSFTGSSSSLPARAVQPASTGIFSFSGQNPVSITSHIKEKVVEDDVARDESPKGDTSKMVANKEGGAVEETPEVRTAVEGTLESEGPRDEARQGQKKLEGTMLAKDTVEEESTTQEETPPNTPAPSPLTRKQKRAAQKQQKKAASKAKNEARNAGVQARRQVQKALLMQ